MPAISGSFGDILDPRFKRIFWEEYEAPKSMLETLYLQDDVEKRNEQKYSQVGTFDNFSEFSGTLVSDDIFQGYDTTLTHREFGKIFTVERKLFDDEQFNILDQKPKGFASAAWRTREGHGARTFNNAFSADTYFQSLSEGVALCSNSHTTTSGASTATGFDNLVTSALSATAVAAARIQFVDFRGDRAEKLSLSPDELLFPPALYETAFEIVKSMGKVDTADNNANVHYGTYNMYEWNFLSDANNWFMMDARMRKRFLIWLDRIALEFGWVEDFETLQSKFRAYMRYSLGTPDWRWLIGAQVS